MASTEDLTTIISMYEPQSERASRQINPAKDYQSLSIRRTVFLISTLNATVLVGAMNTGMMTVGISHMTVDLGISHSLQLW